MAEPGVSRKVPRDLLRKILLKGLGIFPRVSPHLHASQEMLN